MLQIRDLTKVFFDPGRGEVRAANNISLDCDEGVVVLVGANGAGKTTLLRLISGILRPDSGEISLNGHRVSDDPDAIRRQLGYLSPSTKLYPRLTGREMLAYTAGFYGMGQAAFNSALERVVSAFSLEEFLDQACGKYSTGQAQRINLARTLIADPPLLILDEPTTGMDLVAAAEVVEAVRQGQRPGRLILFCTHHSSEVEAVGGRLLIMRDGSIIHDAAASELGSGQALRDGIYRVLYGSRYAAKPREQDEPSEQEEQPEEAAP